MDAQNPNGSTARPCLGELGHLLAADEAPSVCEVQGQSSPWRSDGIGRSFDMPKTIRLRRMRSSAANVTEQTQPKFGMECKWIERAEGSHRVSLVRPSWVAVRWLAVRAVIEIVAEPPRRPPLGCPTDLVSRPFARIRSGEDSRAGRVLSSSNSPQGDWVPHLGAPIVVQVHESIALRQDCGVKPTLSPKKVTASRGISPETPHRSGSRRRRSAKGATTS
jgi:hypothetical protein